MQMELSKDQEAALELIINFLCDDTLETFILRGGAGTGKTTLIAKIVENLAKINLSCALLAPTGRSARILGNKVKLITEQNINSSTIHSAIYTLETLDVNDDAETTNDPGLRMIFPLKVEEPSVSLFIIDEASMVGDKETHGDFVQFGSGRLLQDIVTYSRLKRPGRETDHLTKVLFVGDPAQLPPIGEENSPALSEIYLSEKYDLSVAAFDLVSVMRQAEGSAILDRATEIRNAIESEVFNSFDLQPNGKDVVEIDANQAIDIIEKSKKNKTSKVVVVHSNAAALDYNQSIRERLWGDAKNPIQPSDTLLVSRNSHATGLRNGDLVMAIEVQPMAEEFEVPVKGDSVVKLTFRGAQVAFREFDGTIVKLRCFLLENLLASPARELSPLEQRALLVHFRNRNPNLRHKSKEFRKLILNDPYFNALQVKYGYAMTCHKAQGGEWNTVLVDFSHEVGKRNSSFFRWAYTSITRAKESLLIIQPPTFDVIEDDMWAENHQDVDLIGGQEHTTDADWQRLMFSTATAPLMTIHQELRTLWNSKGIIISQLQHLQNCERYTVSSNAGHAQVQYYYNGKYKISHYSSLSGSSFNAELADEALLAFKEIENDSTIEKPDQFIQDFIDRLDLALADTAIERLKFKQLAYRLRINFADETRNGEIDFTYNGKLTWTDAQEVGGRGVSKGLYEDIQRLMTQQ